MKAAGAQICVRGGVRPQLLARGKTGFSSLPLPLPNFKLTDLYPRKELGRAGRSVICQLRFLAAF